MKYIADNLLPGEVVVYRTTLKPVAVYAPAFRWAMLCVVCGVFAVESSGTLSGALGFAALAAGLMTFVDYVSGSIRISSSAFAITTQRIIIKTGWIKRHSLEVYVGKIEGIGVEQGVVGRMFDYGDITVRGTGGTRERFRDIAAPLEFRRQVQERIPLSS
ncbi:MAG TPA: PH domain-containing protein [Candidatus Acidoferrales bacterium]|nr:PH domain-containing protein [Candidatus Acidoferrales bacterium]